MSIDLADFIRRAALARGIDPEIALRVARSEGGLSDPTKQSDVMRNGQREPSFGPFQLLIGGENGFPLGMGNDAMKAGVDPRTDWRGGIEFALDQARKSGWGPWYGAKRVGVGNMEGIGSQVAAQPSSGPVVPGSMAPQLGPGINVADHPVAEPQPAQMPSFERSDNAIANIQNILGSLAPTSSAPPPPAPVMGPSPDQANALANFLQSLKARMPTYG